MKERIVKYDHNAYKLGKTLKLSIIAFLMFVVIQTMSETRQFFGFDPNSLGSNLDWNFIFYYPMNLLILIICLIVLFRYLYNYKNWKDYSKQKWVIGLIFPFFIWWIYNIMKIVT